MTITVTAEPEFEPPRVRVDLSTPSGSIMQSVALYRVDSQGRELVLAQPTAGFDTRIAHDYLMPYGEQITYEWDVSYVIPDAIEPVWVESWADLADWETVGASWAVSGGALVWDGVDNVNASVSRELTPDRYQVTIAAPPVGIARIDFGGFHLDLLNNRLVVGEASAAFARGTGPWTIITSETSVALTTSASTVSVPVVAQISRIAFVGAVASMVKGDTILLDTEGMGAIEDGAVDSSGRIYLADWSHSRVLVVDAAGATVGTIGTDGTGDGQFTAGRMSVALDSAGNVFVGNNSRIQKFTPSGGTWSYAAKVGASGSANGQFGTYVGALSVDSAGDVWAADPGNHRVQRFTNALVYSTKWGAAGRGPGKLDYPKGITVDSANNVIVSDTGRVQVFNTAGVFQRLLAAQGSGPNAILDPSLGLVSRGTDVWVINIPDTNPIGKQARLQKYRADGTYLGAIENIGIGGLASSYNSLFVAAAPNGDILVGDGSVNSTETDRVQTITRYNERRTRIAATTLFEFGPLVTITETSDPITIETERAWLVHPASPGLSVPIEYDNIDATQVGDVGRVELASSTALHRPLGGRKMIPVSFGPRMAPEFVLRIVTETRDAHASVRALLADETPIMIRIPSWWELGLDEGFYSVGTIEESREVAEYGQPARSIVLPLTASDSPAVTQQNVGWSWAALAAEFPTWAAVRAAFATWADVLSNTRRPGF